MLDLKNEGIILSPTGLEFEKKAVLNPSCVEKDGLVHLFYRAVNRKEVSTIGYCQLKDHTVVKRLDHPLLFPEYSYEEKGLEDPRIIFLEGTYYLFYTSYDGKNALIAYATSQDLVNFTKKGLISPLITYDKAEDYFRKANLDQKYQFFEEYYKKIVSSDVLLWEKDACLFPKKINGKFALMHRVLPGIQILYFDRFEDLSESYWHQYLYHLDHYVILNPRYKHENRNIGGGCPPIETPQGWLLIYHSVEDTVRGRVYHACAALVDLYEPQKVIGRLKKPLFSPSESWERIGETSNIIFPTGAIIKNDRLFIYYGAADTVIGAKSLYLPDLLHELSHQSN